MKLTKRVLSAVSLSAALALPMLAAYAPAPIIAAPVATTMAAAKPQPRPLFLSHILAITDVLNQCGNPTESDIMHCPLVEYRHLGSDMSSLW